MGTDGVVYFPGDVQVGHHLPPEMTCSVEW